MRQGLAEDYACPISSQLMVQPVLAEDGFLYERKAIDKWLRTKATSPKTLRPMGKRLVDDLVAKQTIAKLLEAGAVADDEAVAWHLEKGALHMEDSPAGSGAMLAAEHFRAAADLGSSEGALRLVGAELQRLVGTYADKTGIQLGTPQVFQRRLMTEWEDLAVGGSTESIIWVIDVARELERLCKRPAPGAGEKVGWQKSMAALAGKTYRITCHFDHWRAFQIFDIDVNGEDAPEVEDEMTEMGFNVPFDACALVWRGGEPFPVAQRVP